MKRFFAVGVTIAVLVVMGLLIWPRQSRFGEIERAKMTEPHSPTRIESIVATARKALQLATADTRQRNYLNIGKAQMEWSLMSTHMKTGWLYFDKPNSNDPIWEFAPCSRSNLTELLPADLKARFVGNGDTNGIKSAFDADMWVEKTGGQPLDGRVIPVREWQVVLARLVDAPDTIYAIRLVDQRGASDWGSIGVEYVTIDLKKAEPGRVKTDRPLTAEEERILQIAREAVATNDTWINQAEFEVPRRNGSRWSVTVWRLPKTPGGYRTILIDDEGKVTAYHRGL